MSSTRVADTKVTNLIKLALDHKSYANEIGVFFLSSRGYLDNSRLGSRYMSKKDTNAGQGRISRRLLLGHKLLTMSPEASSVMILPRYLIFLEVSLGSVKEPDPRGISATQRSSWMHPIHCYKDGEMQRLAALFLIARGCQQVFAVYWPLILGSSGSFRVLHILPKQRLMPCANLYFD